MHRNSKHANSTSKTCRERQHSSLFGVNPNTWLLQRIKLHLAIQSKLSYNIWKSPREGKDPQRHNPGALQSGQCCGVSSTDTSCTSSTAASSKSSCPEGHNRPWQSEDIQGSSAETIRYDKNRRFRNSPRGSTYFRLKDTHTLHMA